MPSELSGRALAAAAGKVMGWEVMPSDNDLVFVTRPGDRSIPKDWKIGHPFRPDKFVQQDHECLEWARENWQGKPEMHRAQWLRFRAALDDYKLEDYEPGMWARALVAAAQASEEGA